MLPKNWSAAEPTIYSLGTPHRVTHLLAPRSLLRRVFPQPASQNGVTGADALTVG